VSCVSTSSCIAVGSGPRRPLAFIYTRIGYEPLIRTEGSETPGRAFRQDTCNDAPGATAKLRKSGFEAMRAARSGTFSPGAPGEPRWAGGRRPSGLRSSYR
jgi:hypothetical protein